MVRHRPEAMRQNTGLRKVGMTHMGFIAQEIDSLIKEKKYELSLVKAPSNPTDNYSMAYSELIAPLVKAVQEQQLQLEALKKENAKLKAIQADIEMLKAALLKNQ